jgi:hypothetical protein
MYPSTIKLRISALRYFSRQPQADAVADAARASGQQRLIPGKIRVTSPLTFGQVWVGSPQGEDDHVESAIGRDRD